MVIGSTLRNFCRFDEFTNWFQYRVNDFGFNHFRYWFTSASTTTRKRPAHIVKGRERTKGELVIFFNCLNRSFLDLFLLFLIVAVFFLIGRGVQYSVQIIICIIFLFRTLKINTVIWVDIDNFLINIIIYIRVVGFHVGNMSIFKLISKYINFGFCFIIG